MARRRDTDVVQLKLRLVEKLRKKLEAAAKAEYRSINSEIIRRLEKSFGVDFSPSEEPDSELGRVRARAEPRANAARDAHEYSEIAARYLRWAEEETTEENREELREKARRWAELAREAESRESVPETAELPMAPRRKSEGVKS